MSGAPLTATKLQAPRSHGGHVPRDRLVAAITAASDAKLALLLAPAGSGKTTLLNEWSSSPRERRPFAWLALDPGDNDPVKLFEGAIAALRTVEPGVGGEALASLAGPSPLTEVVLPSLINQLSGLAQPLVLVLDDYHLVTNPRVHEALAYLLEHLPQTVQLALATRAEPPLPLSRLRVRQELVEVRPEALRFTLGEAAALLSGALSLELDPDDVARLQERTEGWAAGLRLAALSLGSRPDAHEFIASFAGDDRPVADYLGFEVLDGQPEQVRRFLLRTSVLERLSGPLCDALTDSHGSAARLDELERAGLFLVPLDGKREWYRCHHLFRDLLRHELDGSEPELVPELHRRACAWYGGRESPAEAIHHATMAGDLERAGRMITEHWYAFLQRGRIETVAGWLAALGDGAVAADPGLCLTRAWIGVNTGDLEDAGRWIEAAERGATSGAIEAGIASLREIHRYMAGDVGRAVDAGRRSVERGETPWRPVGCPVLGIALFWSGRSAEAAEELRDAVMVARAAGNHLAVVHATGGLAAIEAEGGELGEAERLSSAALGLAEERGLQGHWATTMAHVVRGQALGRRGLLDDAGAELERAAELSRSGVAAVEIGYALLWQAEARLLQGRREAAAELAGVARRTVEACPDPGILPRMLARTEHKLHAAPARRAEAGPPRDDLTDRELSVLQLLPSRLSQREIGAELYLSLNTIKTHARSIYRKLDVTTREEAVARARELGLL